ncbi:hypothetical protein PRUPE_8G156500 [Prunus persica]|uniref:Uncharacterized protein n=1 Tax=Prunus persica TaxID=3760 RepID=A0A251MYG0_PRUPE|nr:hypothetical protein PRUPE_8G156500 [Prunus persica]
MATGNSTHLRPGWRSFLFMRRFSSGLLVSTQNLTGLHSILAFLNYIAASTSMSSVMVKLTWFPIFCAHCRTSCAAWHRRGRRSLMR